MPAATEKPISVSNAIPASISDENVPARISPAAADRRAAVLDRQVGGRPRIVAALGLLAQSGDHQDVVVGADGNDEQVQHDRQRERHPAWPAAPWNTSTVAPIELKKLSTTATIRYERRDQRCAAAAPGSARSARRRPGRSPTGPGCWRPGCRRSSRSPRRAARSSRPAPPRARRRAASRRPGRAPRSRTARSSSTTSIWATVLSWLSSARLPSAPAGSTAPTPSTLRELPGVRRERRPGRAAVPSVLRT